MESEVPIGRRVAYWRARRRMSQQVFADRLGKSKSWVDKIERGVRTLDKVSTLRDIAAALRIDQALLLGEESRPADVTTRVEGVELIRAALSAYDIALDQPAARRDVPDAAWLTRSVAHAWTSYQHARYPALIDLLPELLAGAQRGHARDPGAGRVSLVEAYRVTASLLVKLGETELAWLAADRAMTVATGDPVLVAAATVQLGQVLRATGRAQAAGRATLAAAYRIGQSDLDVARWSLCGTLLVQAALAAARHGDERAAAARADEAADLAAEVGDGNDHHHTSFGPTAVALARVAVAIELGTPDEAIARHEQAIGRDGWRWLPPEHRAAHLIDTSRAYLQHADPVNAARVLLEADRTAPAELRHRPAARSVLADTLRHPDAPATIVALAAMLGVSRA
ncbi:helix-turn-helix domain-containing protein [Micromonospora sp. WMMD1082]|uniref:helix-turn-helix domain-containing protein n=1 Tax=Micromonospora sp. WMMD1082 TaxID=3016104 RepID=UPI002416D0BC|nr:helix-turn-helix domain-containing protein [Micromonospora sp. WMMD1082]MDG4797952.1 helix-turn-helix domain-containing protein [Micromonospora sp. WMMD1082]